MKKTPLMMAGLVASLMSISFVSCKEQISANSPHALTVLAGSELKDLGNLLEEIQNKSGVPLNIEYVGTLSGTERLVSGEEVDLAWFSHAKYLTVQEVTNLAWAANKDNKTTQDSLGAHLAASEKTMLSPVVLGVKESVAKKWGWDKKKDLTWKDIAMKSDSGELKYAMTNPAASNSGFTALVGVTAALSGSGDALTKEQISSPDIKRFLKGQKLISGSSGFLVDAYVREEHRLNGMVNYESVLLGLNNSGKLKEKLTLIYPKEGIITADYPLMLLNGDKREQYKKLIDVIRSPEMQEKITEHTLRRPVISSVKPDDRIPQNLLIELPFPGKLSVLNEILYSYLDENRVPHEAVFVLDVSGSMHGKRLNALQQSIRNLAGEDQTLTGRFSRFSDRERVTLIPFSDGAQDIKTFQINAGKAAQVTRQEIRDYSDGLKAVGGTALYTALMDAYKILIERNDNDRADGKLKSYSIVAMTDGDVNNGANINEFKEYYSKLPDELKTIKIYPILFGESNNAEMAELAQLTGGRTFDGHKDLAQTFKKIRGYQ